MVKQSYCTGETGVRIVSRCSYGVERLFFFFVFVNWHTVFCSLYNLKSNSDCVPFEEGLTEAQEEEPPKSLLEVSNMEEI